MAIYALGDREPQLDPTAYVHPDAVVIGDVRLGPESSVWPGAVLRGDGRPIVVGARTSIQDGAVLHTTPFLGTIIGDDCVVGHLAHLEGCTIEDGALVGTGSIVLHQAVVGRGALVAAGAVVSPRTEVPERARAMGVPARITPDSVNPEVDIALGAASYVERAKQYRTELRRLD